jgi:hypothetical protein
LFLGSLAVFGQSKNDDKSFLFDKILKHFDETKGYGFLSGQINDSVSSSSLYRTKEFNISISENPILLDTTHAVIKNSFYTDDLDDYCDDYKNYPVSYSVIFENKMVSLFRNGKFVCHNLLTLQRDSDFESILNTKKFKYHWIINNELSALSGNTIYIWNNNKWEKLKTKFPINKQPKLFEDDEFIVFGDCHGEWGGTVYFFDKVSCEVYFTESTCANSVYKKEGKYIVLAHLGHMIGSSDIIEIENPRNLTKAKKNEINKTRDGEALGYANKSKAYNKLLEFYGIQLFSTFKYQERQLYIVYLNEMTFLAEIKETEIQIVHPLFNNEIYTHQPVTNSYGKYILINLDFYGTALDKEVSVIVVDDNSIIKLDWNEKQSQ